LYCFGDDILDIFVLLLFILFILFILFGAIFVLICYLIGVLLYFIVIKPHNLIKSKVYSHSLTIHFASATEATTALAEAAKNYGKTAFYFERTKQLSLYILLSTES
jgi:alpha-N-acetylglucosamine transferase